MMNAEMEVNDLAELIVQYVRSHDYVSFAEVQGIMEGHRGVDWTAGEMWLTSTVNQQIVLWGGLSSEAVAVLISLLREKRVYAHPAAFLVYLCDGRVPNLPIAKRNVKYKKPHWLPTVLRMVPLV